MIDVRKVENLSIELKALSGSLAVLSMYDGLDESGTDAVFAMYHHVNRITEDMENIVSEELAEQRKEKLHGCEVQSTDSCNTAS